MSGDWRWPESRDVRAIVERELGVAVERVERFPTGNLHLVFDVWTAGGGRCVARLAVPDRGDSLANALMWNRRLRPLGVPLPTVLAARVDPTPGAMRYLLLERLPGTDLAHVYRDCTVGQRAAIAERIVAIQAIVQRLPPGPGFGYAGTYDAPNLHPAWTSVLRASLNRSRQRIAASGTNATDLVERAEAILPSFGDYLDRVLPTPFLDDTTTKNVIVHDGVLSGIVDVDCVCFGDPLLVLALTRMSLLNRGWTLDYVEHWQELWQLSSAQRAILPLYTAIFGVDFLGEFGSLPNRPHSIAADPDKIARLRAIVEHELAQCTTKSPVS